ncbi:MAG: nuclear transport factor 2 family protein [Syntrophaceae bacterium]|nr:nuclear transport factor 2 family protein [Syntrophaceae bacterium]
MLAMRLHRSIRGTFAVIMILCASAVAHAGERTITTSDHLLDRINIEDMFHDYYLIVGNPDRSDISKFWSEDGVFVIGDKEVVGVKAIQALYDNTEGAPEGTLITLMGSPRIRIDGNKATAHFIYTSFRSVDPQRAPAVFEQGQDHVELEKIDGVWMIKRRFLKNYGIDMTAFQKAGR